MSSANKYNKRGILNNGDLTPRGKEIISDYDGNFMLKYSTHISLPNDLSGDFTIIYNANVEHRVFENSSAPELYQNGDPVNSPEWIFGFRGFAVQTLNFETHHYVGHTDPSDYTLDYEGEEVPLLIPGYHFSNSLVHSNGDHDIISILMADGSVKRIQNVQANSQTGIYREMGVANPGFAIVQTYTIPGNPATHYRRIWFKPGDGFTYLFQEEPVDYTWPSQHTQYEMKAMYLVKIFNHDDSTGDVVELTYTNSTAAGTINNGRKIFTGIISDRITSNSSTPYELEPSYVFSNNKLIQLNIDNYNAKSSYLNDHDSYQLYISTEQPDSLFGDIKNASNFLVRNKNHRRRLFVTKITQQSARADYFTYYNLLDPTILRDYWDTQSPQFKMHIHSNLINKINYYNGKITTLDYYARYFGSASNPDALIFHTIGQYMTTNMDIAFRDCYTNWMLKTRDVYNRYAGDTLGTSGGGTTASPLLLNNITITPYAVYVPPTIDSVLTKRETYDYSKTGSGGLGYDRNDNINTTITTDDFLNGYDSSLPRNTPSSIIVVKNYSQFRTKSEDFTTYEKIPTIKLIQETKYSNSDSTAQLVNTTYYEMGAHHTGATFNWQNYYDGSFRDSILVVDKYDRNGGHGTTTTNYSYGTQDFVLTDGGGWSDVKSLLTSQIIHDPKTLYSANYYSNFLPSGNSVDPNFTNTDFIYKIGLPSEEKTYSGSIITSDKSYTYYQPGEYNGELTGKLKRITNNPNARPSYTDYSYYLSTENFYYRGMLKTTVDDRNVSKTFSYPYYNGSTFYESIPAKYADYLTNYTTSSYTQDHFQLKPFKTVLTYTIPSTIQLTSYTGYNLNGTLAIDIDQNGFASTYIYDGFGRPSLIRLKGNFGSSVVSKTISYADEANKAFISTSTDNNPTTYGGTIYQRPEYDALGQYRTLAIDNRSSNATMKFTKKYNYLGLVSDETNALQGETKHSYDALSRLTGNYFPNRRLITQLYDYSEQSGTISGVPYFSKITFTDEVGNTKITYYDAAGNKVAEMNGTLLTKYNYDAAYRLTSTVTPAGKTTSYTYDDMGNIASKTTPNGGTTYYKYDKYGNLRFTFYNSASPQIIVFNVYDNINRLVRTGQYATNYSYYNSLLPDQSYAFESDANNYLVQNMYDIYDPSGSFSVLPSLTAQQITDLNINGRLCATAFRSTTSDAWNYKYFGYDYAGRVKNLEVKYGTSAWKGITTLYNNIGGVSKENINNEYYFWYNLDRAGNLQYVKSNTSDNYSGATIEASYDQNVADQDSVLTFPLVPTSKGVINYAYDFRRDWLTSITAGSNFFYESLTYFNNGNINHQNIYSYGNLGWSDLSLAYSYDGQNRLISVTNNSSAYESFTYDSDGNITHKTNPGQDIYIYTVPGYDKIENIKVNGATFLDNTYDGKGNMTSDPWKGISNITYDNRNLPLSLTAPGGTVYYRYNDGGNRIYKDAGSVKDYYLLDAGGAERAVYDQNTGKLIMINMIGNGAIGRIDVTWNGGTPSYNKVYYINDHLGSIRRTVNTSGTIVNAQDYYAYGDISRSYTSGSANDKYKFTGKERDSETNYDYFGARYLESELGRWMSVDPLADKYPGWSPYNYSLGNPSNLIDPNGMDITDPAQEALHRRILAGMGIYDDDYSDGGSNNSDNGNDPEGTNVGEALANWFGQFFSNARRYLNTLYSSEGDTSPLDGHSPLSKKQMAKYKLNSFNVFISIEAKGQLTSASSIVSIASFGAEGYGVSGLLSSGSLPFTYMNDYYTGRLNKSSSYFSTYTSLGATILSVAGKKYPILGQVGGAVALGVGIISNSFTYERNMLYNLPGW